MGRVWDIHGSPMDRPRVTHGNIYVADSFVTHGSPMVDSARLTVCPWVAHGSLMDERCTTHR